MFDLNAIVSAAISAAINSAVAPLNERIAKLEQTLAAMHNVTDDDLVLLGQRIDVLESRPAQGVGPAITIDEAKMVEALNSQEWFWEKLHNRIDAATEQAIDNHCETYDHDSYDSAVSDLEDRDFDDLVTRDDMRSEIEDVLNNATLSLSI